jgi:peptide/nickel transport system substrate-binding protein
VKKYGYNPEKALALLREAGFVKGPDGILRRMERPSNYCPYEPGQCCEDQVRRVDSEAAVRYRSEGQDTGKRMAALVNEFIDKKNFDAIILGWTVPPDPDLFDVWHSSKQGKKELNFISFENREVDDLLGVPIPWTGRAEEVPFQGAGDTCRGAALHVSFRSLCQHGRTQALKA